MLAILRCDPHSSVSILHYDVITKESYIGKYLSSLRKLDHLIAPKEGFEA